jgi:hypothetical protein
MLGVATEPGDRMTAIVYQLRDYQSSKDRDRIVQMAREIMDQVSVISGDFVGIPYGGQGIDGIPYQAKEQDPA